MNNYSINASVYNYSFQETIPKKEEINNYFCTIRSLKKLINYKPRNVKYYLFDKDIKYFRESDKKLTDLDNFLSNNQFYGADTDVIKDRIKEIKKILYNIFNLFSSVKTDNTEKNNDKLQKIIIFEKWFDIAKINMAKYPKLSDEICKLINNDSILKDCKKYLTILATFNKYVYKNDEIHKMVLSNGILSGNIPITAEFSIEMNHDDTEKYYYNLDNIPLSNVKLVNQDVKFVSFNELLINNYKFKDWNDALRSAEEDFKKYLVFGTEVKIGIEKYINNIDKKLLESKNESYIILKWKEEFPDVLYENLKALNDCLAAMNSKLLNVKHVRFNNPVPFNYKEYFHCYRCENKDICSQNIRFYGVDCTDENPKYKISGQNNFVEKDRIKENCQSGKSTYWLHLRPYTISCDYPLWFLSLRIHFKYLGNKKIEIGWIGRHLYLPCQKKNIISDCGPRKCPLNPNSKDHDPKADELTNYLKQWPEQEPENEPLKAEESRKTSNILPENP